MVLGKKSLLSPMGFLTAVSQMEKNHCVDILTLQCPVPMMHPWERDAVIGEVGGVGAAER